MGRALKGRTPMLERGAAPAARRAAGPGEARPGQALSACPGAAPLKLPQIKNKPEQSELCSDVAERMGFEPM